jgi:hypothetical protein
MGKMPMPREGESMKNGRHVWLLAAVVAAAVGVAEAATVLRLIPGTTVVDTGALLLTGFLASLFAGFYITRPPAESTDRQGRSS